jgi:hypothetical protein
MATTKKGKRHNVSSSIYAKVCYPKMGSPRAAGATFVNFNLDPENARKLADALSEGAGDASIITVRCARNPLKGNGLHPVSVTFLPSDAI